MLGEGTNHLKSSKIVTAKNDRGSKRQNAPPPSKDDKQTI